MTAIGRPPVAPPPGPKWAPPGYRKGRRGTCLGLSCFEGSPVADSDAEHPLVAAKGGRVDASWFTWSRFRKKKKTVPVDASVTEPTPEKVVSVADHQRPEAGEEAAGGKGRNGANGEEIRKQPLPTKSPVALEVPGQGFFWRLWKGKKDDRRPKVQLARSHGDQVSASRQKRRQLRQPPPRLPSITPKYDARRRVPAPPPPESSRPSASRATRAPAAAGCSSPSTSSPTASPATAKVPSPNPAGTSRLRPHRRCEEMPASSSPSGVTNDQVVALSVLAVMLLMMVLVGRVCAIVCTCVWLYFLPRLRAVVAEAEGGGSKSSAAVVDFDSEEYKKRVVLEGLLQRNGRRPTAFS